VKRSRSLKQFKLTTARSGAPGAVASALEARHAKSVDNPKTPLVGSLAGRIWVYILANNTRANSISTKQQSDPRFLDRAPHCRDAVTSACRASRPHRAPCHGRHRSVPNCGARRPRGILRGLRLGALRLQLLPQPALPKVSVSIVTAAIARLWPGPCSFRRHKLRGWRFGARRDSGRVRPHGSNRTCPFR
jgi:hypothetical protein